MTATYLTPAKMDGGKGERTFEIKFPDGHQITYCTRLRNEIVGNHFHKGDDPSKKPEYTVLLSGIVKCTLYKIDGSVEECTVSAIGGPVIIEIKAWVGHTFVCLTDCVFAEYRVTHFDPAHTDCYPLSEMPKATQPA